MARLAKFKLAKTTKDGTVYWSLFVPAHLAPDKKGKRLLFRLRADAERKRGELIAASRAEGRELVLSNAQALAAKRAIDRLAEVGIDIPLDRAIEIALPSLLASGVHMTAAQLVDSFTSLKASEWRPKTARNFRDVASKFLSIFGENTLATISTQALQAWISGYSPTQAAFMVRTINPAFSYAVRQGYLTSSPFERLELPKIQRSQGVDIFTPTEARALLDAAPEDCKAAFAILLFAGIRPTELTHLKWEHVRDGFIHIVPGVAKTSQVRNVEIEPNLAVWLQEYKGYSWEKICPPNWKRKSQAARALAELGGRQDTARHSYATYHLQKYKNKLQLEENMGHVKGSDVLMRHYRAAATPSEAEAYWSILPR